jgi:hypothetical protein
MFSDKKMEEKQKGERIIKELEEKLKQKEGIISQLEKDNHELKRILFTINREEEQSDY